jgi:hypothetical protein
VWWVISFVKYKRKCPLIPYRVLRRDSENKTTSNCELAARRLFASRTLVRHFFCKVQKKTIAHVLLVLDSDPTGIDLRTLKIRVLWILPGFW